MPLKPAQGDRYDVQPPEEESSRWVRRIAHDAAWLGWAWRHSPWPVRVIVWSVTSLLVCALGALGDAVGLPTPTVDDLGKFVGDLTEPQ